MSPEGLSRLEEAKAWLLKRCSPFPQLVVTLGSGFSGLFPELQVENTFSFSDLPHSKPVSVAGHQGTIVIGKLGQARLVCMHGRLHFYEGHTMEEVVFPFRALAMAGAEIFLLTNAAGGLHPQMRPPELILLKDHINWMGTSPLIGPNAEALGPRFPDMSEAYDRALRGIVLKAAMRLGIPLKEGVYVAIQGPAYETPSEVAVYQRLGADVVGMSTVPEVIALRHMNRRIVAISCATNLAAGVSTEKPDHAAVLESARQAHARLGQLIATSLQEMH